eukprot:gnl/Hemi2/20108_TR6665_c0_g3_i1.p2 gnl/Hemi2/20108_TR6665_c0_g3~~gnl/Hemi2/20108_TR6665_c0_g3_i1.p2  ORF type:complete len:121 (+),score=9.69 gnl/Hemi2/20108_TR6665_c0_g3_i1:355-717(+)
MSDAMRIPVLEVTKKKPHPDVAEAIRKFVHPTPLSKTVLVGDRLFTDVVLGNASGMVTVLVDPLSEEGETQGIIWMRKWERLLLSSWTTKAGVQHPWHQGSCPLHVKCNVIARQQKGDTK